MSSVMAVAAAITAVFLPLPCLCQPQHSSSSYFYDICAPSTCGVVHVAFPFTSSATFCGLPGYEITCSSATPWLNLSGRAYLVKPISQLEAVIKVSDAQLADDLRSGDCGSLLRRYSSLPAAGFAPLELAPWLFNLTSFVCPRGSRLPPAFDGAVLNYTGCVGDDAIYYYKDVSVSVGASAAPCREATLPAEMSTVNGNFTLIGVLEEGFPLVWQNQADCWECEAKGGRCGYNDSTRRGLCFCQGSCAGAAGSKKFPWKITAATGVPGVFVILILVILFVKFRERALPSCCSNLRKRSMGNSDSIDVQEFIKTYRSSLVMEYSYLDIKKMTDGLKEKLGKGGCGAVYKGKLSNGQLIAVKILEKSHNSGQDFINEVATIGRIHHVNIIRLLGFCCEGSHRALIYEFMPNGSLGDLISKQDLRQHFGAADLLDIAIGIARGIEYLHQGCETRILHLDIKPHNVLLDGNFVPKISDFGLAKLYSRRDSVVSLTGARGTVGYIAPELFLSNIGAVSHKSDVYSYGMLLIEMVVGRKRITLETEHSSKLYFTHWIYDQLEEWREMEELNCPTVEVDPCISRRMVMVGLWCIQTHPVDRPSITQVLEMLTGRIASIDLPPKPTLFSMAQRQHQRAPPVESEGSDTLFYSVQNSWR